MGSVTTKPLEEDEDKTVWIQNIEHFIQWAGQMWLFLAWLPPSRLYLFPQTSVSVIVKQAVERSYGRNAPRPYPKGQRSVLSHCHVWQKPFESWKDFQKWGRSHLQGCRGHLKTFYFITRSLLQIHSRMCRTELLDWELRDTHTHIYMKPFVDFKFWCCFIICWLVSRCWPSATSKQF